MVEGDLRSFKEGYATMLAMRSGVHVSIAKGPRKAADNAVDRGCECAQIFSSNPRGWALSKADPEVDRALGEAFAEHDIRPVLLHTPYLVNLAAPDPDIYAKSVACLVHAADRARRLDGWVVVHAGRDRSGPRPQALERAAAAVLTATKLVPDSRILIEPTAGGQGSVAARLDTLAELLSLIDDGRVGVCLDTCHAHASGYDLSDPTEATGWLDEAEHLIGLDRMPVLHLNDSRDPCGSNRDRHWHLGEGTIGEAGFRTLLTDSRLRDKAFILETPGTADDDRRNLQRARAYAQVEVDPLSSAKDAARSSKRRRK